MGRGAFDKKGASLAWTLCECVFFSGVVLGWSWLSIIFRKDFFLLSGCNVTIPPLPTFPPDSEDSTPAYIIKQTVIRRPCNKLFISDESEALINSVNAENAFQGEVIENRVGFEFRSTTAPRNESGSTLPTPRDVTSVGVSQVAKEKEDDEKLCLQQREMLRVLFTLVIVVKDLFVLPFGAFFDKYGTTRTRLLTILTFALGTLMMTFTNREVPWLILPALTLTGVAGTNVLLTNVQVANLFGRRRHLVLSLYCGASLSSGFITYMMQLSHKHGVDVQTSFMFLTIGLVPMLVSTVAFLPKTRIPWPLPANYGQRRSHSLDENTLRKQRAWQRRLSGN